MIKLFLVSLLFFILLIAFNLLMDFIVGIPFHISLQNTLNPFWVLGPGELSILVILIMISILIPMINYYKNRTKN